MGVFDKRSTGKGDSTRLSKKAEDNKERREKLGDFYDNAFGRKDFREFQKTAGGTRTVNKKMLRKGVVIPPGPEQTLISEQVQQHYFNPDASPKDPGR